ncbi:MAG TPA: SRPBCC family protein [Terriglobales bacterium]|nr:SRPBCC family protein [Terriglobales bacterium]
MREQSQDITPASDRWISGTMIAAGGMLIGYSLLKRNRSALAISAAGAAVLSRGIMMKRDPGVGILPDTTTSVDVHRTVSIQRPKRELYEYWSKAENMPTFMIDVQSVTQTAPDRQHWKMSFPVGPSLEWDAEVDEQAGERIGWRTINHPPLEHYGSVEFLDGNHSGETVVHFSAHYVLPGGLLTRGVAMMAGRDPEQMARENLRRFKQLMETGELATTAGQPTGRSGIRNQITESLYHENMGRTRTA